MPGKGAEAVARLRIRGLGLVCAMNPPARSEMPLLEVCDLRIRFRGDDAPDVIAVKGISFSIAKGETLAMVGESGSGKSVTALALARLLPEPPAVIDGGSILLDGQDVLRMSRQELRRVRGARIAYIFQEPSASLNPVFSIRSQVAEVLRLHRPDVPRRALDEEIVHWLDLVGIVDPGKRLNAYPHEMSGGMQQRVMIAMALCSRPDLVVADEPTTALDVTIQAQILELLAELKARLGMAILLITHNFGIIGGLADRVAVLYRGDLVENGEAGQVLRSPSHPYTRALMDCIPKLGERRRRLRTIEESMAGTGE
jgi:ABC-type dipeptide/oligopeptide/nickel transport system ATPase component